MNNKNAPHYFLKDGGEMGELMRQKDWSNTPLGDPASWPQSLQTMVSVMLNNPIGMYIAWGSQYIQLYNDAYRPILGASKHPHALGISTKETFSEIWDDVRGSMFDNVMKGNPVRYPDLMLYLNRTGFEEECWFDFSYSPIKNNDGEIGGVLVTVIETTDKKRTQAALTESADQLKFAIDAAELGTWDYDPLTNKFTANSRLKEWFGLPDKFETELFQATNAIAEKDRERVILSIKKALDDSSGGNYDEEFSIVHPLDHHTIIVQAKGRVWFHEDRIAYRFTGVLQEVTEKVLARKSIEESEARFRTIADDAPVFIFLAGENAEVEYLNKTWLDYTGISTNDYKGRAWAEITHEDDIEPATKTYMDAFNKRESFSFENRQKGMDGIYRTILWKATPRFSATGQFIGMMGVGLDIHDRKKSEEKLWESELKVRALVENAPFPIAVYVGKEMIVELANPSIIKLWGKGNDVIGKSFKDILPELDHQMVFEQIQSVLETGESFHTKNTPLDLVIDGKSQSFYFNYSFTPLYDIEGNVYGVMNTGVDLTDLNTAKKQIEESEKQNALLLKLSDTLRQQSNTDGIEEAVTKITFDFLEVDWCHFCIIDGDHFIVQHDAFRGNLPSLVGSYPISNYPLIKTVLDNGHPFVVDNVETTELLDVALKQFCVQLQNIAFIHIPVIKNGNPVAMLSIAQREPRSWTAAELQLTIAIAERTWAAVERTKAEEALLKSEEKYRTLFNSIDQGFLLGEVIRNEEGKGIDYFVHEVNATYEKQTGINIELVLGKTVLQAFPTIDKWWIETYTSVVDNQYPVRFEKFFEFTNRWFEIKATPAGKEMFIILFTDITERILAVEKIKENEERFRTLAESLPQHIWTSDTEGNLNYFNQSVFDYSGLTIEQINKDGWIQIVHPDDKDENIKQWKNAITTGNDFLFEHRFRRYDGEYRWQLSRAIPQKDKNGIIQMWVGTSTDIQEHKTREEKKDEFISIASHEMKTPLTTAKAYLQMLELIQEEDNGDASIFAKKASQAVNRLNELISELLDVSKIRLGKLNYTVTSFNFNDMIASTVENIQLTSLKHHIIKTGQVNNSVTGDKDRLQQVVINLLTNAIKYSPDAEKVYINLVQENESITVSVKDAGIGIAQQSLDKIFEKYHRIEEHAVRFQGLGIGLFISYEIIQRHHGKLWAESEVGKGSTFYFTIPVNGNLFQ